MEQRTIGNGKNFLNMETLQLQSILAEQEAPGLSGKYRRYSTMEVVQSLNGLGWLPVMAQEQRVNLPEKSGFQKHMIRFRHQDMELTNVGDVAAEMILMNSHDGRSSYQIMAGLIRFACLNGLIVSEGQFGAIKVRHVGYDPQDVIEATAEVTKNVPALMGQVREFKALPMSFEESRAFAESALILKYAEDEDKVEKRDNDLVIGERSFNLPSLLSVRRSSDTNSNLWGTFNTVQEKLVAGGRFEKSEKSYSGRKKVRAISGLCENVRVNRGLWHLMEEMAKIKAVQA